MVDNRHLKGGIARCRYLPMIDANGEVFKYVFLADNLDMKPKGCEIWQKVFEPIVLKNKK